MPADPQYDKVSELAKPASPYYGCHNKPRPVPNQPVSGPWVRDSHGSSQHSWPYRFTTDCLYDMSHKDKRCAGCKHARQQCTVYKDASYAPVIITRHPTS